MQSPKLGNPRRKPKTSRKRQRRAPMVVQSLRRAQLMLHETDPITGNQDALYSLSYERYRGYTIYSTPQGRCCIHGRGGCLRLWGLFVCLPDIEEAKTLIKRLRAEGYSCLDSVERYLPTWEFVWLNRGESQHRPTALCPMERVS